jgi:hypothetical protein
MPPTQPKVGDVKSKTGGTTTYYTKRDLRTPVPNVQGGLSATTLAAQVPNVQMPAPINIQPDVQGTRAAGQSLLDAETQRAEQEAANAQAPINQSEQQIRSMFGMLNTESQTRNQLEDKKGVNAFSQDLQKFQQTLRNQIAELDQQDLDNINANEQSRLDSSRRDITKRTYNAMSAEANLQQSIKRASQVAQTRSTIAAIEVTQGNLEAATEQVDKALKSIYDPIRNALQQEMFFLERNDKRFDAAQSRLADARKMQIQREEAQINRANELADMAVASGYATPSEVQQLVGMSGSPKAQAEYAQNIVGRAARAKVAEAQAAKNAANAQVSWTQRAQAHELAMTGDPQAIQFLGYDPRTNSTSLQDDFNYINQEIEHEGVMSSIQAIRDNKLGMSAASGVIKSSIGTAVTNPKSLLFGGLLATPVIAKQRLEVTGALTSLVNTGTFKKLMELKANGTTVGQLTEAERIAIGRAATELFAVLDVDESGLVEGVNTTEARFETLLNAYEQEQKTKQAQREALFSGLTQEDSSFIDNLPEFRLSPSLSAPMSTF